MDGLKNCRTENHLTDSTQNNTNQTTIAMTMKEQVKENLKEVGYSDSQIEKGFQYADRKGYSDARALGSLTLSEILYSDSQVDRGECFDFEIIEE